MNTNDLLTHLSKQQALHNGAWELVIQDARKWAQMKVFGTYDDQNGVAILVSNSDRARQTEYFLQTLLRQIELAFNEDARLGATLSDVTKQMKQG